MAKNNKYLTAYQPSVIFRFLGEEGMSEFHEKYIESRHHSIPNSKPSKEEFAIALTWRERGARNTSKAFNIAPSFVQSVVNRVARYQLRNR